MSCFCNDRLLVGAWLVGVAGSFEGDSGATNHCIVCTVCTWTECQCSSPRLGATQTRRIAGRWLKVDVLIHVLKVLCLDVCAGKGVEIKAL